MSYQKDLTELKYGIVRSVDDLGRVCLPIRIREALDLNEQVEIFNLGHGIYIRALQTAEPTCKWCEETKAPESLKQIQNQFICEDCQALISSK